MLSRPLAFARRFGQARTGNVGIIFALALLPMVVFIGLGVDTARTMTAKSNFDTASDAAALAAATAAEMVLQSPSGQAQSDRGVAMAQTTGKFAGQQLFVSNARKAGAWAGGTPTPNVTVGIANQIITATVSYSAAVPTAFGNIANVKSMKIAGTASSSLSLPKYLNISVAVDVSQSMGLAATQADMDNLKSRTNGCAFGCHVVAPNQVGSDPYEVLAHKNNIQLRIDVIRAATQNMIQTAKTIQGTAGLISFGLYTIQGGDAYGAGPAFSTLSRPSFDYDGLNNSAKAIDLGPNTSAGIGDTDYPNAMSSLTSAVPTSGDGSTASSPQQFVFLLTDGVMDVKATGGSQTCSNIYGGHCSAPFDPTACNASKNKGVTVGVIYTTYLAMPERSEYTALVQSFANQLTGKLQACASPGYFYEAQDGPDIQVAINALFTKATGSGVLTQ